MHSFQRALQFSPWLQQYGSNEVMKLFLSHRANVNARDGHGATALVMATWSDNVEGVRILCQGKVDPNIKNWPGMHALTNAAGEYSLSVMRELHQRLRLILPASLIGA